MTLISRRCFLRARWFGARTARSGTPEVAASGTGADGGKTYPLPPEFTPALLRAEAIRLGVKADASETELAGAVWKAMREGAEMPRS